MTPTRQPAQAGFAPRLWPYVPTAIALLALAATLTFVMLTALHSPEKDDVAWLLYVARKWLAGQHLYTDLVEVNPPLIVWIYAIPAAVAEWLAAEPRSVATPFFALSVLGSAWWTASLLRGRAPLFARRIPVFAVIGCVLLIVPGVEFGQREHLLIAAALPYLVLFARAMSGEAPPPRGQSIAAGIVAGLGCALKPTYVLTFLLVELLGVLRGQRRPRAATVAAALTLVVYGALVVVVCPAFLQYAVPLALALYGGTDSTLANLLSESTRMLVSLAAVGLLSWWGRDALRRRGPLPTMLMLTLIAFAAGAALVFLLQGKNWFYHRIPATVTIMLGLLLWFAAMLPEFQHGGRPRVRRALQLAMAMITLVGIGMGDYDRMRPWVQEAVDPGDTTEVKLERLVRREHAHTYIAFSEWITLGFPVVNNTGVTWASRFDSMWALKGELWRAHQDGTAPKAWPIRRWVAKDFIRGCPDIAVVDMRGINYVAILAASDSEFAEVWSNYRQIAAFDGLRVLKRDTPNCTLETPATQHLSSADIELQ
jgi:hypothetical protein